MTTISVTQQLIHWDAAATAARAAVVKAESLGVQINVAVVNSQGTLMAFLRMPGAPLHSIEIAMDKAYTVASFGLPTEQWFTVLAHHSPAVKDGLLRRPRFVAFGGGIPIMWQGQMIGAIGVSGASEAQDSECAQAGLAALGLSERTT